MTRAIFSFLAIVSFLLSSVQPQQPASPSSQKSTPTAQQSKSGSDVQDVIRITTNLVQVDAVVTKDGKQVTDLKPEDFELFEDGHPQAITNFSYVSNVPGSAPSVNIAAKSAGRDTAAAPIVPAVARPLDTRRTIALVVDDLGMSFQSMNDVRRQILKFINEKLQPNDLVAIIRTGGEVGALQQFTTDRRMLYSAIEHLRWNPCSRTGLYVFAPAGSESTPTDAPCGGQRNLLGSLRVLKFVVQGMRDLPGRKSLVLFSDHLPIEQQEPSAALQQQDQNNSSLDTGDTDLDSDRTSYYGQLHKVAELAIRASVVVYAVDTRGLPYTGLTAADRLSTGAGPRGMNDQIQTILNNRSRAVFAGREGSDLIARETGGFLVRNSNDFGLEKIADDQKGYYLLGYRPTEETFNRKFHHLKVSLKRRGYTVRTRAGFYGISEEEAAATKELTPGDLLNKALMSPFGANDIALRLTPLFANFAETGSLLRSLVYISANDLTFIDEPDGGRKATFDLGIILFGDNGRIRQQQGRTVTLRLHREDYERAVRNGIVYTLDTPLKQAGTFQFRIALRDQNSARIGSAGQFLQIPNLQNGRLALSGLVLLAPTQDKTGSPSTSVPAPGAQQPKTQDDDISSGPAVRRFREGSKILLVYSTYNAQLDQAAHLPQLSAQVRIFREGKPVFTGKPMPIDAAGQQDLKRIANITSLQLGPEFSPGEYVLQVVVTDHLASEKQQTATQWIDFEVVK